MKVGDTAPGFTLKNQNGEDVSLPSFALRIAEIMPNVSPDANADDVLKRAA